MTDDLRYPTGRLTRTLSMTAEERAGCIRALAALPAEMRAAVEGLSDEQLDTEYRAEGWTVRQVVHHVADSHVNAHGRMRRVLTEDGPTLSGYDQAMWARLPDASRPIDSSLDILEGLHARFAALLEALPEESFTRPFVHTDGYEGTLDTLVHLYAWHGSHHVAHITGLRHRRGW